MKTLLYRLSLIAMGVAIASLGLGANFLPATAPITVIPSSYVTLSGTDGGQPASNLASMTESGTVDNWNTYVEFQTLSGTPYSGYQVFTLLSNLSASVINSMSLQVNFRGPLSNYQVWTWSIYDWSTAAWVKVGTNAAAQDWVWTLMTFNIPSPYARYVNSNNELRIRLQSNNAADNADIDYEAITVGYSTSATTTSVSASTSTTLVPGSYVTLSGADGGQPASNLASMTESGTVDNWNAYVEFQTLSGTPYSGYQVFTLPSNLSASTISSMSLQMNFRGPLSSFQIWTWSIYDWSTAAWVKVGTNATAQDWVWTLMTLNIPSPYARYVNSNNELRIRLQSNNAADNADIDYEAITVGYSTSATPTTPVSTSTSMPAATSTTTPALTSTPMPAATPTTTPASTSTSVPTATSTNTPAPTPTLASSNTPSTSSWWKPGLNTSWQIQYVGTIDTSLNVQVYNLDGFDTPSTMVDLLHLRGVKVMCYFSAGTWEDWRPDASSFPASLLGNSVAGWPGETWLDIRQMDVLLPLMEARMDMCKSKGFDGIDPDNIDGYTNNTGFPLVAQNQLTYNIALSNAAHARGLGIGLKNDVDQVTALVSYFDWEVNEQCFEYNECNTLLPFIQAGKPVFNIEYSLATSAFCPQANSMNFNSLKKNLSLDAYRVACR